MATLTQLSFARVASSGNLPVFAGATTREKLLNGRAAAKAVLLKYVPNFKFDVEDARDTMSQVDGWIERNRVDLEKAMQDQKSTLPRHLCISMGSAYQVQQWIIANYTVAAAGLGPWDSGKVQELVADPLSEVSAGWATQDASMRLNLFAMIVKLDLDGELGSIFNPPDNPSSTDPCGTSGLGAAVTTSVIVAIIIAFTALAAVVIYLAFDSRRVQRNNDLMSKICLKAQKDGDTNTVHKCVSALKDIQVKSPFGDLAGELGKVALILGGGYLAIVYGLPWATKQLATRRKTKATA
jgi:hypothetical protein